MKLKLFQLSLFIVGMIAAASCGSDDDTTGGDNHDNDSDDITISKLTLSRNSAIIATGDTIHLSCVITPANATNKKIIWSSQDPSIAVVSDEGIITALAEGDCEISVKAESYLWPEKCKLHVINPDIYKAVDLGLPSGTKWGSKDAGYRFAWADTENKSIFYWGRYKWCNEAAGVYTLSKYCSEDYLKELKKEDDAAYIYGAQKWRTPTKEEFQELIDKCTWTYEDLSHMNYTTYLYVTDGRYKVTGPNGNYIYFDFDGEGYSNYTSRHGEIGVYWSRNIADEKDVNISTPGEDPYKYAYVLVVSKWAKKVEPWARFYGIPIRPVRIE